MTDFWTSEDPPRRVTVKGRSAMDGCCMVVEVEGRKKPITGIWMYPTGYLDPIGRDVFAGPTPEIAKEYKENVKIRDGTDWIYSSETNKI